MPILPFDIAETVIDILSQDDLTLSATKACSLVCQDFLPICRKRIFASIIYFRQFDGLNDRLQKATTPPFRELLSITPEIADHIRDLNYCITLEDLNDPSLIQTFKKITHLRSLYIWINPMKIQLLWNDNPLRPTLLHLLHLPSLTKFRIFGIDDFFLTDLAPCVSLTEFVFGCLKTTSVPPPKLPDSSIGLRTTSVGVSSASTVVHMCEAQCIDGTPFIDFNKLTHISINLMSLNEAELAGNLLGCCKRLVDVRIEAWSCSLTGFLNILRPSFQTLKRVYFSSMFPNQGHSDPLCGLTNELEHMDNDNVIEDLSIEISIARDCECTTGDEWGRLDKALSQSAWAKLRHMSLVVIVNRHARRDDLKEQLQKLPETQFQWLSSTKSLSFEFEAIEEWV